MMQERDGYVPEHTSVDFIVLRISQLVESAMVCRAASGFLVLGLVATSGAMALAQPLPFNPIGTFDVEGIARSVDTKLVNGECPDPSTQQASTSFHYIKGTIQLLGDAIGNVDFDDTVISFGPDGRPTSDTLSVFCAAGYGDSSGGQLSLLTYCYDATENGRSLNLMFKENLQGTLLPVQNPTHMFLQNSTSGNGRPQTLLISRNGAPAECVTPTVIMTGVKE